MSKQTCVSFSIYWALSPPPSSNICCGGFFLFLNFISCIVTRLWPVTFLLYILTFSDGGKSSSFDVYILLYFFFWARAVWILMEFRRLTKVLRLVSHYYISCLCFFGNFIQNWLTWWMDLIITAIKTYYPQSLILRGFSHWNMRINMKWKNPITQYIRDLLYNVNWYLIRGQEEVISYYYASIYWYRGSPILPQ